MALRIDRLTELARVLDTQEKVRGMAFNMDFFHAIQSISTYNLPDKPEDKRFCGSAGCIGGWAVALFDTSSEPSFGLDRAFELLVDDEDDNHEGDFETLQALFYPPANDSWVWITPKVAALAVQQVIATCRPPDWKQLERQYNPGFFDHDTDSDD